MTRQVSRWPLITLHSLAALALASMALFGSLDFVEERSLDPILESGKWALRFLLLCLAMTPLQTYFGWRGASRLRKPAGLWAFGFAALHGLLYLSHAPEVWPYMLQQPYLLLGAGSLAILTALALTSHRRAMRWLGQGWKRLHRLVYLAGATTTCHALLAAAASKRVLVRDPQAADELRLYAALVVLLLVVRLPLVRRRLQPAVARLRLHRPRATTDSAAPSPAASPMPLPPLPGEPGEIIVLPVRPAPYEPLAPEMPDEEEVAVR